MIPQEIRLFTWVDVEEVLLHARKTDNWPDWLLWAQAYWDALTIGILTGKKNEAISWLSDIFDPRFQQHASELKQIYILLESLDDSPRQLEVRIAETEETLSHARFLPHLKRPEILSPACPVSNPDDFPSNSPPLIALHSFKGGVGRTLHAVALAKCLAGNNSQVLLADGDMEAPGISWLLKERLPDPLISFVDFLALIHGDPDPATQSSLRLIADRVQNSQLDQIFLLPAFRTSSQFTSLEIKPEHILQGAEDPFIITNALSQVGKMLGVDAVIIDLRAGLSEFSTGLLLDPRVHRIIVTTLSSQSIQGTGYLLRLMENLAPPRLNKDPLPKVILSQIPEPYMNQQALLDPYIEKILKATPSLWQTGPAYNVMSDTRLQRILLSAHEQKFMVLPRFWDEFIKLLQGSELFDGIKEWIQSVPDFPVTERPYEIDEAILHNMKSWLAEKAENLLYAKSVKPEEFVPIKPVRNLAADFQKRVPIALITGAKGSGKTYTFLQIIQQKSWRNFIFEAGTDKSKEVVSAECYPVFYPQSLSENGERIVSDISDQIRKNLDFGEPVGLNEIFDFHKQGLDKYFSEEHWAEYWMNLIAWRMGFCVGETDAGKRLPRYLREKKKNVILVIDGLEEIFQGIYENDKEKTALRALLYNVPAWLEQQPGRPLGIVIFVRRDMITIADVAYLSDRYAPYELKWNADEALRLVLWIVGKELYPSDFDISGLLKLPKNEVVQRLIPLWGRSLDEDNVSGASSWQFISEALSDSKGEIQARDIVRFIYMAASYSEETEKQTGRILSPAAIHAAVQKCSAKKIEEIKKEHPFLEKILTSLSADSDQPITLGELKLNTDEIRILEDNGIIKWDVKNERYLIAQIFRHGLNFSGVITVISVNFETWFVALKLADAFFDEEMKIKPHSQKYYDSISKESKIISIDNVQITSLKQEELYILKFSIPKIKNWELSALKNHNVLFELKEQFRLRPDRILNFVSQNSCQLFQEVLTLGASCSSRKELESRLKPDDYLIDWDNLKNELDFSDMELIRFSNQFKYKHIIDTDEIMRLIRQKFKGRVTNASIVDECLYQLAIDACKNDNTIDRNSILSYFARKNIYLKPYLKPEALFEKINTASVNLHSVSNTFFNNCHIERKQTEILLDWIKPPLPDDKSNVAVLTGKAGSGKSVILRDLLEKLKNEEIPVLGIKTDLYMSDSVVLLSQDLGLSDGIKETLASVIEEFGMAVILLDQLDALSQTLSKDRKAINTYINLVSQLTLIHNLKIIISCRVFDLKYDPLLRSFEDKYTIEVEDLNQEEIGVVLSDLGIEKKQVPNTLMELLKVPLHLKVFSTIYNEETNLASLKTLQDLYDELWNQRILSEPDIKAVETITDYMNDSKSLSIPYALLDNNDEGRNRLLSHSILIKQKNKLQYFHQSFFDYCYSRTFLSQHTSLIDEVLNRHRHQGLFIRPQIKQVLSYLRGTDFQNYLKELRQFLTNSKIRFHIWLLVVNQLASEEHPTNEEWSIVKPLLDSSHNFTMHFIDAVQSEKWLKRLIDNNYLHLCFESADYEQINLVLWKLKALINHFTDIIVDFLYKFPDIEKNDEYVFSILQSLEHWKNKEAVNLFKDKFKKVKQDKMKPFILKKIFKYNPQVVCQIFFDDLNEKLDEIESEDGFDEADFIGYNNLKVFEKLLDWNENDILLKSLKTICDLVKKTRYKSKSDFYHDTAFVHFERFERDLHEHWIFFSLVEKKLVSVAEKDKSLFLKITSGFQNSYSYTILKLLVKGYLSDPEKYIEESYTLLTRESIFEQMSDDITGGYEIRSLLSSVYPYFLHEQKKLIKKLILSIYPYWESRRYRGYTKYRLICAIPKDDLKANPTMERQFFELERKFGKHEDKPPMVSKVVQVGPPLPTIAYEKMSLEQWILSFKRYDDSTGWDQPKKEFLKGGLVEHSRAFTKEVSTRPDEFYDFILHLGEREGLSITYLEAGISGLVEANYNISKVKKLVRKYWSLKDSEFRRGIIRAIDYIDKHESLDLELLSIIEDYALNDPDPDEELWRITPEGEKTLYYGGDSLTYGINTVRGAATYRLAIHGYKTPYSNRVFDIMEKITDDVSISVRCCLIKYLQGMLKWNKEKTYELFMKLTKDKHPKIIKYGFECLYYLMTEDNFNSFIPLIKIAMETAEKAGFHDFREDVGQILTVAYVRGYSDSKALLENGFQISDEIKAGAIKFASRHLFDHQKDVAEKSRDIYLRFLNDESDEISSKYGWAFKKFKPENFNKLYELIELYTKSKAVRKHSEFFVKYLKNCVMSEPEKCIELIQNYSDFEQPNLRYNVRTGRETVQILVEAYNKVTDDNYKEKVMNIFDKILKDQAYKYEGLKVLREQDRG
ncbi:MAG: AAA family ATPase [Desulfobacteraceae bacterium]|nr:AAA family ATPase [Desulfobacteraceae bacterium]